MQRSFKESVAPSSGKLREVSDNESKDFILRKH